MSEPDQDYRDAAETLSALVGQMIEYLENAPARSIGGRWRDMADQARTRFNTAKVRQRQGNLFGKDGS